MYKLFILVVIFSTTILNYGYAAENNSPIIKELDYWLTDDEKSDTHEINIDGGKITFKSIGASSPYFMEIVQPKVIEISESKEGILKEGTNIYLKVDNLKFCDYALLSLQGDIEADYSIEEGILKLSILKTSSIASKIKVSHIAVDMGRYIVKKPQLSLQNYVYSYPLYLLNDDLENNFFSSLENDFMINENFVSQQERHIDAYYEEYFSSRIIISKNTILFNNKSKELESPCFLKDDYLMIPFSEIFYFLRNTNLNNFTWNENGKDINFELEGKKIKIPINAEYMWIDNEKIELHNPAELINGDFYLPLRDFVKIIDKNSCFTIDWDVKFNTAILFTT